MRKLGVQLLLTIGALTSANVFAHSEHDKARFVAMDGVDSGKCENRFRPCKTLAYAARQANKGDKVLLAEGQYALANEEDLFYLIGDLVPVKGGYSRVDHYQEQNPNKHRTLVLGVPKEYVDSVAKSGFNVIRDGKAGQLSEVVAKRLEDVAAINQAQPATECVDGMADSFSCSGVSLLSHVPLSRLPGNPNAANDIWGHIDLNTQKEYAIIGMNNGVAVIDVSDPENPVNVGSVSGQNTTWRDIKVYQYFDSVFGTWRAYAYVTADSASDRLTVIDLNDLENGISILGRQTDDVRAHNIYISNVDYGLNIDAHPTIDAQIHIMGSNNFGGAIRSYSLANPSTPQPSYVPRNLAGADYSHDASSVMIDDARVASDCAFENQGTCTVMLDFNEGTLRLWDHTMPTEVTELSETSYANAEYTHSGWWSEDKQYVILHDELDESRLGLNTRVLVFDISDLTAPELVATWNGPTKAIDHNGFARGDRYYMSNYTRGLTILDISDPTNPTEAGFFDTYPFSDTAGFNGAWGVYPFLPSGNILVSDIQGGLFVLQDNTKTAEANTVGIVSADQTLDEGQQATFEFSRTGTDAFTVDYQIVYGNTSQNDSGAQSGTLSWAQNETANKTVTFTITDDGVEEPTEQLFVTLVNPNGASLQNGQTFASVTIPGNLINAGTVGFTATDVTVKETDGTVMLEAIRSGGRQSALTINYQLVSDTAEAGVDVTAASGQITWADGEGGTKAIEIAITDDSETESLESLSVMLSADDANLIGEQSTLAISIRDDESNEAPVANAGNDTEVNTRASVTLTGSASDPESQPISTSWEQTEGPTVVLSDASGLTPSFTAPDEAATLTFTLTATDDFGVDTSDSVTVTVIADPAPAPTPTPTPAPTPTPEPTPPTTSGSGGGGSTTPLGLLLMAAMVGVRRFNKKLK